MGSITAARFTAPTPTREHSPSHSPPDMHFSPGLGTARALGWFSIALGVAELVAPGPIGNLTGVRRPGLLQLHGLREVACGIGILTSPRPSGWMWARLAGDMIDLATLGEPLMTGDASERRRALASMAAVGGVAALDATCAAQLSAAEAMEG